VEDVASKGGDVVTNKKLYVRFPSQTAGQPKVRSHVNCQISVELRIVQLWTRHIVLDGEPVPRKLHTPQI
jgi:hypothetical protein